MRRILSGSDGGEPIKVAATSSPGTAVHTVGTGRTQRLTLQAVNTDGTDRLLTVQWGDTGEPDNSIEVTVPAGGGIVTVGDFALPTVATPPTDPPADPTKAVIRFCTANGAVYVWAGAAWNVIG